MFDKLSPVIERRIARLLAWGQCGGGVRRLAFDEGGIYAHCEGRPLHYVIDMACPLNESWVSSWDTANDGSGRKHMHTWRVNRDTETSI